MCCCVLRVHAQKRLFQVYSVMFQPPRLFHAVGGVWPALVVIRTNGEHNEFLQRVSPARESPNRHVMEMHRMGAAADAGETRCPGVERTLSVGKGEDADHSKNSTVISPREIT